MMPMHRVVISLPRAATHEIEAWVPLLHNPLGTESGFNMGKPTLRIFRPERQQDNIAMLGRHDQSAYDVLKRSEV